MYHPPIWRRDHNAVQKPDARKQDSCWDFVYKLPFFLSLFSLKIPVLLTDFLIVNLRRFSRLMCPLSIVVNWLSACHITKGQDFSRNKNIFLAEHFLALCPSSEEIGLLSLKAIFRAFCKMQITMKFGAQFTKSCDRQEVMIS